MTGGISHICQGVITLVTLIPAMADKFALRHPDLFDDVVRAGILYMLLSFDGMVRIDYKLTLAAVAAVGAKNGEGDHDWR